MNLFIAFIGTTVARQPESSMTSSHPPPAPFWFVNGLVFILAILSHRRGASMGQNKREGWWQLEGSPVGCVEKGGGKI